MKERIKTLIIASLISIGLLILFTILNLLDSKILSLDVKWIIVSGIPILIGLMFSGIIKSFKGFGVELETNLSEKIETDMIGEVVNFPTPEITKQSMQFLYEMSPKIKSSIERLQFILGKKNYYDSFVINEYLRSLHNLKFIEIIDNNGRFIALLPARRFTEERNHLQEGQAQRNIQTLINSIESERIIENFSEAITDTIKKTDSLLEAYKKFKIAKQGKLFYGDHILPVIDSNDKMIGLTRKNKLTEKIVEQVIKSEK